MKANRVLGIIFSNAYDSVISELTDKRTMGSVPFGGRYRLIDFVLSNMVNCGIDKVGVITKSNFQSLMDHLGTGKPWDLARKTSGMYLLPPFNNSHSGMYRNRIDALNNISDFMNKSVEDYVLLSDCNTVCSLDYSDMLSRHFDTGADITVAYHTGKAPNLENILSFELDENEKITSMAINEQTDTECNHSVKTLIINKALLLRLVHDAAAHNKDTLEKDILLENFGKLDIRGYKVEGFCRTIDSLVSYYNANMDLLNLENCRDLFNEERPVYTKVRDDMPTIYGLGSSVKNSLIADGCTIDGEIENCIVFRGVTVAKGAKVKNSIIMQGSFVSENASLDSVILDKDVTVRSGKALAGASSFPVYVGKNIVI